MIAESELLFGNTNLICDLQRPERLVGDAAPEGDLAAAEGPATPPRQLQLDVLLDAEKGLQDVEAGVPANLMVSE